MRLNIRIIHFADLHLGVESYGHIDPANGLPSRLNDFLAALDQLVDYALENIVDLVVFCGDAYKSREPSQTQQREFAKRINRLSTGNIPVFLLAGNHDMPNAFGRATATEIFDTLAVKNVYVANKPDIYRIPTAGGPIQVVALPWLRRSTLLSREDTRNLSLEQVNQRLQQILTDIIAALVEKLDPSLPAILAAHVWVSTARVGSESLMTIGQEHALLVSNLANPAFDYVALGHVHKQQVLAEKPPVVYAGSLERVDFGEENDAKGFYVVEIPPGDAAAHRQVSYEFHPVDTRRFLTISAEVKADDLDPTATVLRAIAGEGEKLRDAIVRLIIKLPEAMEGQLRQLEIREALKEAHYFTIAREIQRQARLRMGDRAIEGMKEQDFLKLWLDSQKVSPERQKVLLEYGEKLIEGQPE